MFFDLVSQLSQIIKLIHLAKDQSTDLVTTRMNWNPESHPGPYRVSFLSFQNPKSRSVIPAQHQRNADRHDPTGSPFYPFQVTPVKNNQVNERGLQIMLKRGSRGEDPAISRPQFSPDSVHFPYFQSGKKWRAWHTLIHCWIGGRYGSTVAMPVVEEPTS